MTNETAALIAELHAKVYRLERERIAPGQMDDGTPYASANAWRAEAREQRDLRERHQTLTDLAVARAEMAEAKHKAWEFTAKEAQAQRDEAQARAAEIDAALGLAVEAAQRSQARVAALEQEARRIYLADGTYREASPEEVIAYRKAAAVKLARVAALELAVHRFLAGTLTTPVWSEPHAVRLVDELRAALASPSPAAPSPAGERCATCGLALYPPDGRHCPRCGSPRALASPSPGATGGGER